MNLTDYQAKYFAHELTRRFPPDSVEKVTVAFAGAQVDLNPHNLGAVYGDRDAGDPVEYDHLRLILTDDTVEITVFNRGITLFLSDDEKVRRIHRVLCKLDQPKNSR